MDLRQLEYFMHVANTLNITHAAARAHVSQPALSRQMKLLEQELGTRLFQRKARGVALTEAGQRLVERARLLLASVEKMKDEIMSSADEPVGTLRLAASNSLSGLLTTRVVSRYRRTYPQVSIHVTENTSMAVRDSLVRDGADVALLADRESFTTLTKIPLVTESLLLIAPVEAGLTLSRPVSPRSLTGRDLVLTPFPNALRRAVDEILVRAGGASKAGLEVDTNGLMINLVKSGTGYCVLPYSGAHDLLLRKEISAAPIRSERWGWAIAVSRDRAITTATRKLIEIIIDEVRILTRTGIWKTASLDYAGD